MNIAIMGTGYVGLVTGTCFAESGHQVICVDIDQRRIQQLSEGIIPFYEPGLKELTQRNIQNHRLHFTTDTREAIEKSRIIFIAVGTPSAEDGTPDLKQVTQAVQTIAEQMNEHKIIVIKSTVPVGASRKIQGLIQKRSHHSFSLVSNPEFLKEGSAVSDFMIPERVVVGTTDPKAIAAMKELYEPFVRSGNPILLMDIESAELAKYACNAFLATKISFINEIANLCGAVHADINNVRDVMMTDSRIGKKFLYPGTGYGGSCFPKDIRALMHTAHHHDQKLEIIQAVHQVNEKQKEILFQKISRHFNDTLNGLTIAVWGVSFKPNTDDIRQAPSVAVIQKLLQHQVNIRAYDPIALPNARLLFENRIRYHDDCYACLKGADALLIFTEWNEFRKPDFVKIKSLLKQPLIFDGRNLFDPSDMKKRGFYYAGVGIS